jgi:lactate dehydrogenase-like 2-hydroxyacid dehydrogenase
MTYRLLNVSSSFHDALPWMRERLEPEGIEVTSKVLYSLEEFEQITQIISQFNALCTWGGTPLSAEFLQRATQLEIIAHFGIGFDGADLEAATRRGIVVTNCPDTATIESVAELAWGMALSLARQIPESVARARSGAYERGIGKSMWRKTLGVVGLGRIGKAVARRAIGFEMRTLAFDQFHDSEFAERYGVQYVDLDSLLAQSDYVVLCLPGSLENESIIDRRRLALMKPTAYLINVARYKLIDGRALREALNNGRLAGAGLDFYGDDEEEEKAGKESIFRFDQVHCTPHLGNRTHEGVQGTCELVADQISAFKQGRKPPHILNPEVWESDALRPKKRLVLEP